MSAPQVTARRLASIQVCVPQDYTDDEVVKFANGRDPTGLDHGWEIRRQGDPSLRGDAERVCCAMRPGFVHLVLDC